MPVSSQSRRKQSAGAIAELIETLSRALANRSFARQLNPAQWAALRYLANANERARETGAFAKFHRTTPSSASQTIGALVKKGMVVKKPTDDGRRRTLELTTKGRAALENDPIKHLSEAILRLPDGKLFSLAETMQALAQALSPRL
jgi:DNA-binding MarR family transcriptional regulator